MAADDPILLTEHALTGGHILGQAELNVPGTLNSLSLEMTRRLDSGLRAWADRDEVVAVVITGSGDKAFCAGGDIQALYHAIGANHAAGEVVDDYPFRFFEEEYRLDYYLHVYPKPVVTIGHGIVMGGGLGIFGASEFRVLTDRSRLAVPEITIGLFPDAGATWTLKQMAPHHAAFLGLTGSHVNASDALTTGMGTHVIAHDGRSDLLQGLMALGWQGDPGVDREMLKAWLDGQASPADVTLPAGELGVVPESLSQGDSVQAVAGGVFALAGASDWVDRGIANLRGGCPTTAGIVYEQLRRAPELSLADSYRLELTVATHCANNEDFHEGVRALLIDKDGAPQWRFGDLDNLQWEHVLSHFEDPWPAHPLADLG